MFAVGRCGLLILLCCRLAESAVGEPVRAQRNEHAPEECDTSACHHAAGVLSSIMNTNVSACDNFFDYACGGWVASTEILGHEGYRARTTILTDTMDNITKDLIEDITKADTVPDFLKKPQVFYESCMDDDALEAEGHGALKAAMDAMGGWPLVQQQSWSSANFRLTDTLAELQRTGDCFLFRFYLDGDLDNSSISALILDQQNTFGIGDKEAYFSDKTAAKLTAYREAVSALVVKMTGSAPSQADLDDMISFEYALVNSSETEGQVTQKPTAAKNNRYQLSQLEAAFPGIQWPVFFRSLFQHPDVGVHLPDTELVINFSPHYFSQLSDLLAATNMKTVANYLMWRLALKNLPYLSEEYREIHYQFEKVISGQTEMKKKQKHCLESTKEAFGQSLGHKYVKEYVAETTKTQVEEMIVELKTAFTELVKESEWMDGETRAEALNKIKHMGSMVAYSDNILDTSYLTEYYKHFSIIPSKFFDNKRTVDTQTKNHEFRNHRQIRDKQKVDIEPMVVNARYYFDKNLIVIIAAIINPPLFNSTYPRYMNYAGIGSVIGHEITHGYDTEGRKYDAEGNAREWWTDTSSAKYKEKEKCFIDQYNSYISPEANVHLDGNKTLTENIADGGGIQGSFRAYRNWVQKHNNGKEEKQLPSLGLSPNQLFFLSHAQVWCSKFRPKEALNRIQGSVHSQQRFRVLGPLQNSKDFAEAFNCSTSSNMVPDKRCVIW